MSAYDPAHLTGKTESVKRARLAILVGSKGRGSNMRALAGACRSGQIPADVAVVVSPVSESQAVDAAHEMDLAIQVARPKDPDYATALLTALAQANVDIVCLAGLMTKLPVEVLQAYPGRILNIHPALLPKFGGKGMYGHHVHEAVIAAGEAESGCSVHVVTEEYDEGPVVLQESCPVVPGDTAETLATRVLALEHQVYPRAVRLVIERMGDGS